MRRMSRRNARKLQDMKQAYPWLLAAALLLSACGSSEHKNATATDTSGNPTEEKNWYRQYTGTIAGKHVTVDMYEVDGALNGSYTYDDKDVLLDIYQERDSSVNGMRFLYESVPTDWVNGNANHHWEVTLTGNTLKGKWVSQDGTKHYDIDLKESDYSHCYRFDVVTMEDSVVVPIKNFTVSASISHLLSLPGAMPDADKAMLTQAVAARMECTGNDIVQCTRDADKKYFDGYKSEIDTDITEDESGMDNYEEDESSHVVYNKNGLVVLQHSFYSYMGGAHGIYGSEYTCIDMRAHKVLELGDVLHVDTVALQTLLADEARVQFQLAKDAPLSDALLVDTVDVTGNFYLTMSGLVFQYTPYAIASYADGEVLLFLPYNKLTDMLQPDFKERLGITK